MPKTKTPTLEHGDTFALLPLDEITISTRCKRVIPKKPDGPMKELIASIKKLGVSEPVLVRRLDTGGYELGAGRRRYFAASKAGLTEIPAIIKDITQEDMYQVMLAENLHRADLTPFEEAMQYKELAESGNTTKEIAAIAGKDERYITRRLRLTSLIKSWQDLFLEGAEEVEHFTPAMCEQLAFASPSVQLDFLEQCQTNSFPEGFTSLKEELSNYTNLLKDAPFDPDDATLCPDAGACTNCPYNSEVQPELFAVQRINSEHATCTNEPCFNAKKTLFFQRQATKLNEEYGRGEWAVLTTSARKEQNHIEGFKYQKNYWEFSGKLSKEATKSNKYPVLLLANAYQLKEGTIAYTNEAAFTQAQNGKSGGSQSQAELPVEKQIEQRQTRLDTLRLKKMADRLIERIDILEDAPEGAFGSVGGQQILDDILTYTIILGTETNGGSGDPGVTFSQIELFMGLIDRFDNPAGHPVWTDVASLEPEILAKKVLPVAKRRIKRLLDYAPPERITTEFRFFTTMLGLSFEEEWDCICEANPVPKQLQALLDNQPQPKPQPKAKGKKKNAA
jgi:ParB/RepB/Spo0J family partition protein